MWRSDPDRVDVASGTMAERIFPSFDGVELAVHEMGQGGRPLVLLHGLFSNAHTNWIRFGHAARLAEAGFHLFMPDLRAHGKSAAPHDPAAYPADVLLSDARYLIEWLGLSDFDLGGFSLGARTVAHLLADGIRPRRAILAGMGLQGLSGWAKRRDHFRNVIAHYDTARRGDSEWMAVQFMKTTGIDKIAVGHLLGSFSDLEPKRLGNVDLPVQVLCGHDDRDNGDPEALAALLPQGELTWIPGDHMGCVVKPELGQAMVDFLHG